MEKLEKDVKYWVGFSKVPGIGRVRFGQMENYFGSLETAWEAGPSELKRAGLDRSAVTGITNGRPKISLDEEIEKLEQFGVSVITCNDPDYPARLREIYDYPPLIYIRGTLLPEDE